MGRNKSSGIVMLTITVLLIAGRDLFQFSCPFAVFTALSIITGLISNNANIYLYATGLLPFCRGIPYSEILLSLLFLMFLKQLANHDYQIKVKYYFPVMIILIIEMCDYLVFGLFSNEIIYLCVYMLFVSYGVDKEVFRFHEEKTAVCYTLSTIASVIIVVLREINLYGMQYITTYNVRFGANTDGLMVTNYNSNELGLYCCIAVAIMLSISFIKNDRKYLVVCIIASIVGFFSISRSFMLVLAIIWIVYLVRSGINAKMWVVILVVIGITIFIIGKFFPDLSNWLVKYYETRSLEARTDGFGGRISIFETLINASFDNIYVFLCGYSELYTSVLGTGAAHNGIQEIVISWGLTGLFTALYWIYNLVTAWRAKNTFRYLGYLGFVGFFLYIQTLQLFTMHNYLVVMLVSLIPISYYGTTFSLNEFDQIGEDYE